MPSILIHTDIHANYDAYVAFKRYVDQHEYLKYDRETCLGDVLGYYGKPVETWNALHPITQQQDFRPGNHDIALVRFENETLTHFNDVALIALAVQRAILGLDYLAQIREAFHPREKQLPYTENGGQYAMTYVHGRPDGYDPDDPHITPADMDNNSFRSNYLRPVTGENGLRNAMAYLERQSLQNAALHVLFFGHTHLPTLAFLHNNIVHYLDILYTMNGTDHPIELCNAIEQTGISFDEVNVVAVNPGSIGQPRDGVGAQDGQARAHGVLLDEETGTIRFIAVPYDYMRTEPALARIRPSEVLDEENYCRLCEQLQAYYRFPDKKILLTENDMHSSLVDFYEDEGAATRAFRESSPANESDRLFINAVYDNLWSDKAYNDLTGWLINIDNQRARQKYVYEYQYDRAVVKPR